MVRLNELKQIGLAEASPFQLKQPNKLEAEANAELAPQGTRSGCAARVDEARRMTKRVRRRDITAEVVAIVRAVGQVECLRNELQLHLFAEFHVLCQS